MVTIAAHSEAVRVVARLGALAVVVVIGGALATLGLVPESGQDRALVAATIVAFVILALGSRRDRRQ